MVGAAVDRETASWSPSVLTEWNALNRSTTEPDNSVNNSALNEAKVEVATSLALLVGLFQVHVLVD